MTTNYDSLFLKALENLYLEGGGKIFLRWEEVDLLPHVALIALFNKRLIPKGFGSSLDNPAHICLEMEVSEKGYEVILSIKYNQTSKF